MVINRIIDNASVAIASFNRKPVVSARQMALAHPRKTGANVFGLNSKIKVDCEWAAWANGTAVRELDYHDTFLAADYSHPGDNIVAERNTVLAPSFNLNGSTFPNGGTIQTAQSLIISSSSSGASIRYSTDGSIPTRQSTSGSSPLTLSLESFIIGRTYTVRAIAVKDGLHDSTIASVSFTVSAPPLAQAGLPTFRRSGNPPGTNLMSGTNLLDTDSLIISSSTSEATIYYRAGAADVAAPTRSSSRYSSTIDLAALGVGTHTIRAIAVKDGLNDSGIAGVTFTVERDVDRDNDGLMEIDNLEMLDNIRHNLMGTNYKTSSGDTGSSAGASATEPANCNDNNPMTTRILCGYELTRDLDFASAGSYASGRVDNNWIPGTVDPIMATTSGFPTLGGRFSTLSAIFEGNGYTISNFYQRYSLGSGGLFIGTGVSAVIRNVGILNATLIGGAHNSSHIGPLTGNNGGTIIASHASGGNFYGRGDHTDRNNIGGLVGVNERGGRIIASYATGNSYGSALDNDQVGGLVGENMGTIIASYATGDSYGGSGSGDLVGGLVGDNEGTIIASYATGNSDGRAGNGDLVGGLVGRFNDSDGMIVGSYAIGNADGGSGTGDMVGSLVGSHGSGNIAESYGFGTPDNGAAGSAGSEKPDGVSRASDLAGSRTETGYAGDRWNDPNQNSAGAWHFDRGRQKPALVYADYDGTGNGFPACNNGNNGGFPATIPGSTRELSCGSTLIGGQRR